MLDLFNDGHLDAVVNGGCVGAIFGFGMKEKIKIHEKSLSKIFLGGGEQWLRMIVIAMKKISSIIMQTVHHNTVNIRPI